MLTAERGEHEVERLRRDLRREASAAIALEQQIRVSGAGDADIPGLRQSWSRADALAEAILAATRDGAEPYDARAEALLWLDGDLSLSGDERESDLSPVPGSLESVNTTSLLSEMQDVDSLVALSRLGDLIVRAASAEGQGRPMPARFVFKTVARFGAKLSSSAEERLARAKPSNAAEVVARAETLYRHALEADPDRSSARTAADLRVGAEAFEGRNGVKSRDLGSVMDQTAI